MLCGLLGALRQKPRVDRAAPESMEATDTGSWLMRARRNGLAVTVVLAAFLGGCGGQTPEPGSASGDVARMWVEQMDQLAADDTSGRGLYEAVFADYEITSAEVQEATQGFEQCMAAQGFTVSFVASDCGFTGQGNDGFRRAEAICGHGRASVWELPCQMTANPQGITWQQEMRECFEANGATDGDGMSDSQLGSMVEDWLARLDTSDARSDAARICAWDAAGEVGWAIEDVERMEASLRDPGAIVTPVEQCVECTLADCDAAAVAVLDFINDDGDCDCVCLHPGDG